MSACTCPWPDVTYCPIHGPTRGRDNATGPVLKSLEERCEHSRLLIDWCMACRKVCPHAHVTGDLGDGLCHDCGVGGL